MAKQAILDAVRKMAKALHKAGAVDATTMREFDALYPRPVKHFNARQIRKLRLRF